MCDFEDDTSELVVVVVVREDIVVIVVISREAFFSYLLGQNSRQRKPEKRAKKATQILTRVNNARQT